MSGMTYDEATAARLEAIYLGSDVRAQRDHTITLMRLKPGDHVLDIGSGPGFLARQIGALVGPTGSVFGVDISQAMVDRATFRNPEPWIRFETADATRIPVPDAASDMIVSTQVAEYVADTDAFCQEAFRVLKPGGRAVILATDWASIAWHSLDPARMTAVLNAFAGHCAHISLPRTLGRHLRLAGFQVDRISAYPILNTDWSDDHYSCQVIPFISSYVANAGLLSPRILEDWAAEQRERAAAGDYYFLTNRIFFKATKPIEPR